jgi:hypothetical protein
MAGTMNNSSDSAQKHEHNDEQIADHSGEIAPEVTLENRQDNVTSHLTGNLAESRM